MRLINIILFVVVFATAGCKKEPVGYLLTENASYAITTLDVYDLSNVEEGSDLYYEHQTRIKNKAPWVSLTIDGVLGTNPITYQIASVTASNGGNAEIFMAEVRAEGGGKIVFPFSYKSPKGSYLISVKVINEGYEKIIPDAITIIIH